MQIYAPTIIIRLHCTKGEKTDGHKNFQINFLKIIVRKVKKGIDKLRRIKSYD